MKLNKIIAGFVVLVSFLVFVVGVYAATTEVVTGDTSAGENQPGWLFNRDLSTSTPFEFNSDESSIGMGSLYVMPIGSNSADKFIGENFLNMPVADVNSIAYDFLIGSGGSSPDAAHFYMNVYANFGESDDLKFYDCRYNIVPAAGSTTGFTTVTFDPTLAYPVTTRSSSPYACPDIPADMDTLSPGSNIRAFALNVGDSSGSDIGLDGYLDNVAVDITGGVTIYDFEPATTPVNKDECKKGGWMTFNTPVFKNQGECVSFVASGGKSQNNPGKK
jgi:hypothetical protein